MNKNSTPLFIDSDIRYALENDEFTLVYQPQVNLKTGVIIGLEALIRWQHPSLGQIETSDYITYAEREGLVYDIDNWVLKKAASDLKHWLKAGIEDIRLSVNVSALSLSRQGFADFIINLLQSHSIPAYYLEIEITETSMITNLEEAVKNLNTLNFQGLSIAIDDFGTGYSSLSYLHELPVQTLKIDRSFLQNRKLDLNTRTIINTIIAMAKNLNLKVVAEGVETQKQIDYLQNAGCNEAQGFYFSEPLEAERVPPMLDNEPLSVMIQHGESGIPGYFH